MLTPIRRVLVPVDFSEGSRLAVQFAVDLARERQARVFALHILSESMLGAIQEVNFKGYKGEFVQTLRKLLREKEHELDTFIKSDWREGIDLEMLVRRGDPVDEVLEAAKDLSVDVIVLGTRSHSAVGTPGLGSVARELSNRAPCSIVLVREAEHDYLP